MDNQTQPRTIAVVGGTGKEGSGLALRWALSGQHVIIGSRSAERAQQKAEEMNQLLGSHVVSGTDNLAAVQATDLVVLCVPYDAHQATLQDLREALQGKVMIDVTVPLKPPAVRTVYVPQGHAASLESQQLLGSGVRVVAAFQNVSAVHLQTSQEVVHCDVLICGDDEDAKQQAIFLAQAAGMHGVDAGPLANAVAVEALTPVLLHINKRYKVKGAGIVITGIKWD